MISKSILIAFFLSFAANNVFAQQQQHQCDANDKHCICVRDELIRRTPHDLLMQIMQSPPSEERRQRLVAIFSKTFQQNAEEINRACNWIES